MKILPGNDHPTAWGGALPAVDLLLQPLVQLLRDVGPAGGSSAGTGHRVPPASGILPVCGQSHQLSGTLPAPSPAQPPVPPRLTRVLVRPRPVHGVQQGGHQPVVGALVGTDQVGEGAETLGLDALDGLGRQSRGSTVTSPSSARAALARFVQWVCPSQCARGGLEGPAGHRTHGVRSVETSASFSRQGFSPWTPRMLFLRSRKGSCRELGARETPRGHRSEGGTGTMGLALCGQAVTGRVAGRDSVGMHCALPRQLLAAPSWSGCKAPASCSSGRKQTTGWCHLTGEGDEHPGLCTAASRPHPAPRHRPGQGVHPPRTHLHGEQPLLIGEDAVGVDVPLEPGESR